MPENGVTQKHRLSFIRRHNTRRAVKEAAPVEDR